MGAGYWIWLIPLSSGKTSVGIVVHDQLHSFESVRTIENSMSFIKEHEPQLFEQLTNCEVLDFGCFNNYSYSVGRCYSDDRWAIVGEAAAFPDPLYSPGTDFIGLANSFAEELIRTDYAREDLSVRARELTVQYRTLVMGTVDIFRNAAPVYGHARAMRTKIYYDNFTYWSFPCQYYQQQIYRLTGGEHAKFATLGQRFVELSNYVQALMRHWALVAPEEPTAGFAPCPTYPSVLVDAHVALQDKMSKQETLEYISMRAEQAEQLVGELLLRLTYELGEQAAKAMFEQLKIANWTLSIDPQRLTIEPTIGLARRRALPRLTRDIEHSLGRMRKKTSDEAVAEILAPLLAPLAPATEAAPSASQPAEV
jgi:hypothetical protein